MDFQASSHILKRASLVLFFMYLLFMVWAYSTLPEQIAINFGVSGEARSISEKSIWTWFMMPFFLMVSSAYVVFIVWAVSKGSINSMNFPEKKKVLQLDEQLQEPFRQMVLGFTWMVIHITILYMIILFFYIAWQSWLYSTEAISQVIIGRVALVFTILYLWLIYRFYTALKAEIMTLLESVSPQESIG